MHARCGPQQSELVFACGENTHSVGVGRPAALQARAARKHARRRLRRMHCAPRSAAISCNCAPRSAAIGCGATTKKAVEALTLDERTGQRPPVAAMRAQTSHAAPPPAGA